MPNKLNPPVIKNYREFRAAGMKKPDPKAKPLPEIVTAKPIPTPEAVVPPPPPVLVPVEPVAPSVDDTHRLLLESLGVTNAPAEVVLKDGLLPEDPNKVVIGGVIYEVEPEKTAEPQPELKKPEPIVAAEVVQQYVPVNPNLPTTFRVCLADPPSFIKKLGSGPGEILVRGQVRVFVISNRHFFYLEIPGEAELYPLQVTYFLGGVEPFKTIKTSETLMKQIEKDEHRYFKESLDTLVGLTTIGKLMEGCFLLSLEDFNGGKYVTIKAVTSGDETWL